MTGIEQTSLAQRLLGQSAAGTQGSAMSRAVPGEFQDFAGTWIKT